MRKLIVMSLADLTRSTNLFNYFSGWIENFGVVPLFLLAAFLLFPKFFNLLALLVFVTRVLETIFQLLTLSIQLKRSSYLSLKMLIVKGLLLSYAHAADSSLTLSIGEHSEISARNLREFSIGNKEIINARYSKSKNKLIIKAKKIGHTELSYWDHKQEIKRISLFVINKRSQLKLKQILEQLHKAKIQYTHSGNKLTIWGAINNIDNYKLLHDLKKLSENDLTIDAELAPILKNKIILEIYSRFFEEGVNEVKCTNKKINISCYFYKSLSPSKEVLSHLETEYNINFIKKKNMYSSKNFKLKLKIINIERTDGKEISTGFDKIEGSLSELFQNGLRSLILKNQTYFKQRSLSAHTLAEPEIIIKLNENSLIQVGKDIPFQVSTLNGPALNWQFAGFKLNLHISSLGKKLFLNYKNEITTSAANEVQGSKGQSKLQINLNTPSKLFEVGLGNEQMQEEKLPFLGSIPLIGKLFTSQKVVNNYKRIIAYVTVEQI